MAKDTKLFHVFRYDYFGDTGKQIGSNLTEERAKEYADSVRKCDRCKVEVKESKEKAA